MSSMDQALFDAAQAVRQTAHAPYSGFFVGAAIRTESGSLHSGCNVENAAYPLSSCAEASAVSVMISASATQADRRIAEVCVVADKIDGRLTTPCGGCRQRLAEFASADTLIHIAEPSGGEVATYRLGELLPAAFTFQAP